MMINAIATILASLIIAFALVGVGDHIVVAIDGVIDTPPCKLEVKP